MGISLKANTVRTGNGSTLTRPSHPSLGAGRRLSVRRNLAYCFAAVWVKLFVMFNEAIKKVSALKLPPKSPLFFEWPSKQEGRKVMVHD